MKRSLILRCCLYLIVSTLLLSCMPATAPASSAEAQSGATAGSCEQVYKIVHYQHGPWSRLEMPKEAKDDIIRQYMLENYCIDFEIIQAPADNPSAHINSLIAAGNIPDLIQGWVTISSPMVSQWVDQGILLPLTIDDYPAIKATLSADAWDYLRKDEEVWGFAAAPDAIMYSLWIREDWLEKLGLEEPKTIEDIAAVAEAFTTQDPDGNGQNDTYGFGSYIDRMDFAFLPFGAYPTQFHLQIKEGQVVVDGFTDEAKAAITWFKEQIDAGVVLPDWATNSWEQHKMAVSQGRVGMTTAQINMVRASTCNDCFGEAITSINPDAKWKMLNPVEGPAGAYHFYARVPLNNAYFVTISANSEPGKFEALMRMMNDAFDTNSDLYRLTVWGVEDVTYWTDESGNIIERILDEEHQYMEAYRYWRNGNEEYWQGTFAKTLPWMIEFYNFTKAQPNLPHVTNLVTAHPGVPDLTAYIKEMHIKFITGTEPIEKWDEFVQTGLTTYGGQEIIDDATRQLTARGMLE